MERAMTPDEYQEKAAYYIGERTAWSSDQMMMEGVVGLAEEAGEVAAIINRYAFRGEKWTIETETHLGEELGDALWYLCEIATAVGISLSDIMKHDLKKLKKRYPDGFMPGKEKNHE